MSFQIILSHLRIVASTSLANQDFFASSHRLWLIEDIFSVSSIALQVSDTASFPFENWNGLSSSSNKYDAHDFHDIHDEDDGLHDDGDEDGFYDDGDKDGLHHDGEDGLHDDDDGLHDDD